MGTGGRFLGRLLLVHGHLADYRLGRLIKYSFYKNISFACMFFFFQFFNGWSGQVLPLFLQEAGPSVLATQLCLVIVHT